jgi:hypothetical protein
MTILCFDGSACVCAVAAPALADVTIKSKGGTGMVDGWLAQMMKEMANTITTEVTSASTAAIDTAIIEIPAD